MTASPPPYRDKLIVKITVKGDSGSETTYDVTDDAIMSPAWQRWMANQQKLNQSGLQSTGFIVTDKSTVNGGAAPDPAVLGLQVLYSPDNTTLPLGAETAYLLSQSLYLIGFLDLTFQASTGITPFPSDPRIFMSAGVPAIVVIADTQFFGDAYPLVDNLNSSGKAANRWTDIFARTFTFDNLPVYANNAAATGGGLTAGQGYRTATGQVMVVF